MSKLLLLVSAYIFLICAIAQASPQNQAPDAPQETPETPTPISTDDLSISPTPALPTKFSPPEAYYYPYQQQLTLRLGAGGTFPDNPFAKTTIGFQYLFPKFLSPKLEAGADLQSGGDGHLFAGMRWIWAQRSYFRPSLKLSADHLVVSSQGMATFTHFENYYLRGSAAAEYVFCNPYSLRPEFEMLLGSKNVISVFTIGLSRGF
jgi:hypothetical protein